MVIKLGEKFAPTFLFYCLSANVGGIVDKKTVMSHEQNGDFGNAWLKTNSAGSGPFALRAWRASESVALDANPNAAVQPKVKRLLILHRPDSSAQLLALQKGDVDIARNLSAEQIKTIQANPDFSTVQASKAQVLFMAMNQSHPNLAKPQVRQAIKWAIDYKSIATNITPNIFVEHQAFLPRGLPGALTDLPFKKDVEKAKGLLKEAGLENGFEITLDCQNVSPYADIAQALQADLAAIGIKLNILPAEFRQVITKTRARKHELALTRWGSDYMDPNSNAQTFCENIDNGDDARDRTLAWRSSWQNKELTQRSAAAVREQDADARVRDYERLQRDLQEVGPFAFMLQQVEIAALRKNVSRPGDRAVVRQHQLRGTPESLSRVKSFAAAVASIPITLFGLVLITFLIGRVVPIDPVLAVVGDRAPQEVVERTRHEMGLDRPLPEQFVRYVGDLAQGNLGRSVMTSNPVTTDIARFFPATLELSSVALVIATLVGVPLGVYAAVRQGSWIDQVIRVVCLSGHSIPVFVLALLALLIFYATLGWAPGPGRQDVVYQDMVPQVTGVLLIDAALAQDWDALRDAVAHLALPALVLAAFNMAYIARMTRAFMLESLRGEYIITARAKGLLGQRASSGGTGSAISWSGS